MGGGWGWWWWCCCCCCHSSDGTGDREPLLLVVLSPCWGPPGSAPMLDARLVVLLAGSAAPHNLSASSPSNSTPLRRLLTLPEALRKLGLGRPSLLADPPCCCCSCCSCSAPPGALDNPRNSCNTLVVVAGAGADLRLPRGLALGHSALGTAVTDAAAAAAAVASALRLLPQMPSWAMAAAGAAGAGAGAAARQAAAAVHPGAQTPAAPGPRFSEVPEVPAPPQHPQKSSWLAAGIRAAWPACCSRNAAVLVTEPAAWLAAA